MAATDKTYRSQNTLDIVFGVSCVLMLLSVIWMFAQDYFRDYKVEQRHFRDVEVAMAQRDLIKLLPDDERKAEINAAADDLAKKLAARNQKDAEIEGKIKAILPDKQRSENRAQALKAELDSQTSLLYIAVDERNAADPKSGVFSSLSARADEKKKLVEQLRAEYLKEQQKVEEFERKIADIRKEGAAIIDEAVQAEKRLKELTEDFDRFAKLTATKQWTWQDRVRSMPVVDAFATPTKIQQITLENLPINYNFKYVTRYDRCGTCHQGIDRPGYDKETLRALTEQPAGDLSKRLANARALLQERRQKLPMLEHSFSESSVPDTLHTVKLTNPQLAEYASHPRLDLFVGEQSPHAAMKFGCTVCHEGQGSGTDFFNASHFPNDAPSKERWTKDEHWHSTHYWDYPMLPSRFIESSCLKCHHEVTGLLPDGQLYEYRNGTRVPAPGAKVTAGHDLVRLNGCFGCHEIHGMKANRAVGPDLRLEPWPALDYLTADAKVKALADPANPPGKQRKVGPSLKRLSEKTNETWVRQWIDNPRGFRSSTRMPHFYHQANNDDEALKGTDQEGFPAAEIHAVTYYLFRKSDAYVADIKRYDELNQKPTRNAAEDKELAALQEKLAGPGTDKSKVDNFLVPLTDPQMPAGYTENKERGRLLFTEKGCLACHQNDATKAAAGKFPSLDGQAEFGPDLTRIALKLGDKPGDEKARRWLIQWIRNPSVYHPRTFMPVTHLQPDEAADLAAWLLDQKPNWQGPEVATPDVEKLKQLARVFLIKSLPRYVVDEKLKSDADGLITQQIDKDDQGLAKGLDLPGKLKVYIGKKSVNQLGCFGCHDVSGFEAAKPIGTPLNDWGRKDAERLAFEDVMAYVGKHYREVPTATQKGGLGHPEEKGKKPFEAFFMEALDHHQRDGFLYQKLQDPRSYDHDRMRTWDERLRMPQFKFARERATPLEGEELDTAKLRTETAAREQVMTFVLGLVAEPIPFSYLYDPPKDRAAVVHGKSVLDKYNCAGCHQLNAGIYEFSTKPALIDGELQRPAVQAAEDAFNTFKRTSGSSDIIFPNHNAFAGTLSLTDRLRIHAIPPAPLADDAETMPLRLTRALRFNRANDLGKPAKEREQAALDLPAGQTLGMPAGEIRFRADPHGGTLADLLVPYLIKTGLANYNSPENARSGLPPPLMREGEKVQPGWLFQFLRDPQPIRPVAVLRMPKFNMSEEEAMALVNYFGAYDRLSNPGIGLDYPYLGVPQRDPEFWVQKTREYNARLGEKALEMRAEQFKPIWEKMGQEQVGEIKELVALKEKELAGLKDQADIARVKGELAAYQKQLEGLQSGGFAKEQRAAWMKEGTYSSDAFRLMANICSKCHQIGNLQPNPIGPPLALSEQRLRPDWTERWVASPQRMLVYPSGFHPMPNMFFADKLENQNVFAGTSRQQAAGLRDILMDYARVANMPVNRSYRPPAPGGAP